MKIEELYRLFLQHPEVTTDSRNCPPGSIFFALKGENFDGNCYALSALDKGCSYAVVDNPNVVPKGDSRLCLVNDALLALQQLATHHRQRMRIPVIQITGTNGKTTTKELISAVLQKKYNTLYTQGNLNNHIGVPRTLLRLTDKHEMAVIETGANHPGEIDFLCRMVQADYGLITNVGRAHLEGFGSFEGVKRTKGELYDDLAGRNKSAFLNVEDPDLRAMADKRKLNTIPYVKGEVLECNPMLKVRWQCPTDGLWHNVCTHLIGAYNLANVLSAITVGQYFGVSPEDIDRALEAYSPTNSRSEFKKTESNSLIIDAYNANPTSMSVALDNFRFMQADNKMAILGDMKELGKESIAEHQKIVDMLSTSDLKEVWLVGSEFALTQHAILSIPYRLFANVDEVKAHLASHPIHSHTILIKGSNGTRLFQLPDLL